MKAKVCAILRTAAKLCLKKELITKEQLKEYFISSN